MTLTEFLTARLDEDEAAAKAASRCGAVMWWTDADGGVVYDPARVLREVEAKRTVLAMYADAVAEASPEVVEWMLAVVETEARMFSDHPDYDPAWA